MFILSQEKTILCYIGSNISGKCGNSFNRNKILHVCQIRRPGENRHKSYTGQVVFVFSNPLKSVETGFVEFLQNIVKTLSKYHEKLRISIPALITKSYRKQFKPALLFTAITLIGLAYWVKSIPSCLMTPSTHIQVSPSSRVVTRSLA